MAVHKLVLDDFVDADYSLFAIHCDLEDYRLAFHINCALNTNLKRTKEDIDFNDNEASFSLFEWENTNLKNSKIGDMFNIEIDMLARYVHRALKNEK